MNNYFVSSFVFLTEVLFFIVFLITLCLMAIYILLKVIKFSRIDNIISIIICILFFVKDKEGSLISGIKLIVSNRIVNETNNFV
jgi:hypothetical protein